MNAQKPVRISIDAAGSAASIDPRIYGQYLEHVEDCIYPGVHAQDACRKDVIEAVRDLATPIVRWPGGCFADIYHWEDGVGPAERRPLTRNWHWGGVEPNRFGTHEFLDWAEAAGSAPYVNVNLGTGTLDEALRWLDYVNGAEPTREVLRRRASGRHEPWNVRHWGIGNETWGPWEAGHSDAETYATTLANWADFFKRYDPDLQLIGVGSRAGGDSDWDRLVLDRAGAHLDFLSLHLYGASIDGREHEETPAVVATPAYLERRIERMAALVREHAVRTNRERPIRIAVDEWNIRHYREEPSGRRSLDRSSPRTMVDALFVAGFLHAMIRHCDVVGLANYVFLVNGHGVIQARDEVTPARGSALYAVFRHYRRHLTGRRLPLAIDGPRLPMPRARIDYPGHPVDPDSMPTRFDAVDAVACGGLEDGDVTVALVNRDPDHSRDVRLDGFDTAFAVERLEPDPDEGSAFRGIGLLDRGENLRLPPLSLTFLRAEPA